VVGHIVDNYFLGFDTGVVHIVVFCYIVNNYYLWFNRVLVHIVVCCHIVDNYCLRFYRGWLMLWFVTLSTTTLHCLTEQLFVFGFHIVDSYCLRFDK
jgi:hypothetical protein